MDLLLLTTQKIHMGVGSAGSFAKGVPLLKYASLKIMQKRDYALPYGMLYLLNENTKNYEKIL